MSGSGVTADITNSVMGFVDYNEQVAQNTHLNESVLCLENINMDLKETLYECCVINVKLFYHNEDLQDTTIRLKERIYELQTRLANALTENETLK